MKAISNTAAALCLYIRTYVCISPEVAPLLARCIAVCLRSYICVWKSNKGRRTRLLDTPKPCIFRVRAAFLLATHGTILGAAVRACPLPFPSVCHFIRCPQSSAAVANSIHDPPPTVLSVATTTHHPYIHAYNNARLLLVQIGIEVAQSNAAWLLEAGHCGGGSVNGTKVSCEKRWVGLGCNS